MKGQSDKILQKTVTQIQKAGSGINCNKSLNLFPSSCGIKSSNHVNEISKIIVKLMNDAFKISTRFMSEIEFFTQF